MRQTNKSSSVAAPQSNTESSNTIREITHWIDGKAVRGTSGRTSKVFNPATGKVQATVPMANSAELGAAVESIKRAFPGWAAPPPLRGARVLFRVRELLESHLDEIAALISSEYGKVLADARGEAMRGYDGRHACKKASGTD